MKPQVFKYRYRSVDMDGFKTARFVVPPGADAMSYCKGRADEMAEAGKHATDFEYDPTVSAFYVRRVLKDGSNDVWCEFHTDLEAAETSWKARTGDWVVSVDITPAYAGAGQ